MNESQEDFDFSSWGIQSGIGAASGMIASPVFMAGGAVIGATTTTVGRVGAIIGTEVAGNMAHGASMRVLFNAHDGKHLTDGLAQDMIVRGITGGIAGGVGIGASEIVSAAAHGA